ncbi:MAG: FHA domain-containing protein [Pseudomonadota bacterium]
MTLLDASQANLASRIRRTLKKLVPSVVGPAITISIGSGLQHGLDVQFESETVTVGSDDDDDLVLLDDTVARQHAVLRFKRSIFGDVAAVSAQQGKVVFCETEISAGSHSPFETLPQTLILGDIQLTLKTNAGHAAKTPSPVRGFLSRFALFCCLFILLLLPVSVPTSVASNGVVTQEFVTELSDKIPPAAHHEKIEKVSKKQLEARLTSAALNDFVSIKEIGGGLVAEGILSETRMVQWLDILYWYDGQSSKQLLVSKVKTDNGLTELPPVASIRLSDPQGIMFADGRKIGIGESVKDGWVLEKISNSGMVLERDGEKFAISF